MRGGADLVGNHVAVIQQTVAQAKLGLGHEIDRAEFQRPDGDFGVALGQRGHHHHRHGPQAHQTLEEIQAVHARHFDVQGQHVGIVLLDELARDERIGRGRHDFQIGVGVDDFRHQTAHQGGIIDAQHADFLVDSHFLQFPADHATE
jgi:hypothetical protein